ncbi:hypothetical protein C4G72_RS23655 [Vibrio parahaemolyticus]|nr:hypothetical protein [Vibrio parahaemolyticus]
MFYLVLVLFLSKLYQVSGIRYQVSGIRYQVSGIRYQVSGIRYQVSGIRYLFDIKAVKIQASPR